MSVLQKLVSKEKRRYKGHGFDLDLAYINKKIIAMGFPSESMEAAYRNPMKEVQRFLDQFHKDHYKVYNLCSERGYDPEKFYNRVAVYPFDDHNAPPFELILQFCKDVEEWLKQDEANVAAIHCKAGKGRTGLMVCAWLLFSKQEKTVDEALYFYGMMRTQDNKGVTIPSQVRYIQYFHESLTNGTPIVEPKLMLLNRIVFHTIPKSGNVNDINFTIQVGKSHVFTYKDYVEKMKLKDEPKVVKVDKKKKKQKEQKEKGKEKEKEKEKENGENGKEEVAEDPAEEGTVTFECGHVPVIADVKVDFDRQGNRIFQFWFNTAFVKEPLHSSESGPKAQLHLIISKTGLDKANKDKKHKDYDKDFCVELIFTPAESKPSLSSSSSSSSIVATSSLSTSGSGSVQVTETVVVTTTTTTTTAAEAPESQQVAAEAPAAEAPTAEASPAN
jgi:phosphatidylinositol-3,4,5-trisphosphate 3-phosphatase/dual-specificity protein phosphatase PTEN